MIFLIKNIEPEVDLKNEVFHFSSFYNLKPIEVILVELELIRTQGLAVLGVYLYSG